MQKKSISQLALAFLSLCWPLAAQDDSAAAPAPVSSAEEKIGEVKGAVDGLNESYLETKTTVDKLKKIKLSGYVQAQYRMVMDTAASMDSTGKYIFPVGSYSGGAFVDGNRSQFQVRRGRIKVMYDNDITEATLQLDMTQAAVALKEAYAFLSEPWCKTFGLRAGVFNRPFGFEVGYSSSSLESPERSRVVQILFPGEVDLGAALEVAPAEKYGWVSHLNLKGGLFNGMGVANENDDKKDFIGRLGFSLPFTSANLEIDGGFSSYMGSVVNTDTSWGAKKYDTTFTVKDTVGGVPRYSRSIDSTSRTTGTGDRGFSYEIADGKFKKSTAGQFGESFDRNYMGVDLQVYYDTPIGGLCLRGEYIGGTQPGTSGSSNFYNAGRGTDGKGSNQALYLRDFSSYYVTYVQNLGTKDQVVLKYDAYDPNTGVAGADVKYDAAAKKFTGGLSLADLAFTTVGLGLVHHWDENIKFIVYYDMVTNETATDASVKNSTSPAVKGLSKDIADDVLTLRVQYKF